MDSSTETTVTPSKGPSSKERPIPQRGTANHGSGYSRDSNSTLQSTMSQDLQGIGAWVRYEILLLNLKSFH
ncbi:hypothetical protein N7495_006669 [Penicillium taxi]|uniref:uncharacterized protein n=1 Tax=Penicillium taxi TaxID=168475 RepID=UPI0025456897|nr:uncharacterized protein N7495_006669 [Penicillium taxi]KAJ5894978.1 hypothetical protein N7495_006669 [Penicillium taxi]